VLDWRPRVHSGWQEFWGLQLGLALLTPAAAACFQEANRPVEVLVCARRCGWVDWEAAGGEERPCFWGQLSGGGLGWVLLGLLLRP